MSSTATQPAIQRLKELSFRRNGNEFRRKKLAARIESRWLTFASPTTDQSGPLSTAPAPPGLWKNISLANGRSLRVFDLPLTSVAQQESWDDETGKVRHPLDELVDWVDTTQSNELPEQWQAPPREELERSLPESLFTAATGRFARQVQLVSEGDTLAASVPLLQQLPSNLVTPRRVALERLLIDVQNKSRLVRLILQETNQETKRIVAEVDLSGVPSLAAALLVRIGLDALQHVVSQHVSTVELLVDPTVEFTAWDFPSAQECPAEGR